MAATSTTAGNLNARDSALLALLSSADARAVVVDALNKHEAQTNSSSIIIDTLRNTLRMTIRYTASTDGLTVTDSQTGLTWQKEGSADPMKFASAEKYVAKLNAESFGGFSDWRLPTDHELCSIVDRYRFNPAIDPSFACRNDWYWTATPYASSSGYAWGVYFYGGYVGLLTRGSGDAFVRAVRGASPAGQ